MTNLPGWSQRVLATSLKFALIFAFLLMCTHIYGFGIGWPYLAIV